MQLTLPQRGTPDKKNYRPRMKFDFSVSQRDALNYESFASPEVAQQAIGKHYVQVMRSLVNNQLFVEKRNGSYDRTRLGREVAELLSERV